MESNTKKIGSKGPEVSVLQNQLKIAGYDINVDGIFGTGTAAILKQFQLANQLIADGIAGPSTLAALSNYSGKTLTGIDISHFTGNINWNQLANEVSFVYCKASQGGRFQDPTYQKYRQNLSNAGIIHGAYHFLNFQDSVQNQVTNFLNCRTDYSLPGILPPVLDIEWQASPALNQNIKNNRKQCISMISEWLSAVQQRTGRLPMIYTNASFWQEYLNNPPGFEKYLLWIASYRSSPPPAIPGLAAFSFWQNSDRGQFNSIANPVDRNVFMGTISDLKKLATANNA